jgi:hypothetical protein
MFGPTVVEELEMIFKFTALDKRSVRASLGCSAPVDFSEGRAVESLLAVLSAPSTV